MSKQKKNNSETLIQQEQQKVSQYKSFFKLDKENGRVSLTQDNAAKIETLILLNPRYGNVVDETSTNCAMYYINQLKTGSLSYNKGNIELIIKCINSENSTRMSNNEMKELAGRVIRKAGTKKQLLKLLKNSDNDYQLIGELSQKTTFGKRRFSFATKFCHYMCFYLFDDEYQDYYSIYDNVVINCLPYYINSAGIKEKIEPFTKDKNPQLDLTTYYKQYQIIIDKIIRICSNNSISRNAFDHILWYSSKLFDIEELP